MINFLRSDLGQVKTESATALEFTIIYKMLRFQMKKVFVEYWETTICPRSSYPFYIVTYCMRVTTSWTDST